MILNQLAIVRNAAAANIWSPWFGEPIRKKIEAPWRVLALNSFDRWSSQSADRVRTVSVQTTEYYYESILSVCVRAWCDTVWCYVILYAGCYVLCDMWCVMLLPSIKYFNPLLLYISLKNAQWITISSHSHFNLNFSKNSLDWPHFATNPLTKMHHTASHHITHHLLFHNPMF